MSENTAQLMFSHTEYEALQVRAGLLDRRSRGRILLSGSDRRAYLQGLLTNDILALSRGLSCYAALLTPQGRMISDMRVSEFGELMLIDLPGSTADAVRQRFQDFIFTEDVEVQDAAPALSQLGLYGPRAADVLAALVVRWSLNERSAEPLGGLALGGNAVFELNGTRLFAVRSDDYGIPGYEVFVDASRIDAAVDALLDAGAEQVSAEAVQITRVEAGRPEFGVDMDEHTIPLEAGIEERAISLTKGCYVGQEIIIRVLHRGHGRVAKLLVGFIGDPKEGPFLPGARLRRNDRDLGTVTSAVLSPRLRRPIGLGYVHRDHAGPGTVLEVVPDGGGAPALATIVSLPFVTPAAG